MNQGNDETHWVGHDRTKTIDHDKTTHIKHDRTETVDNNETITTAGGRPIGFRPTAPWPPTGNLPDSEYTRDYVTHH